MLVKDLITQLEALITERDANPEYKAMMGEADIVIDMFRWDEDRGAFNYIGFSQDVKITKSADGVYDILTAIEDDVVEEGSIDSQMEAMENEGGQ